MGRIIAGRYRLDEPIAAGGMGEVWRGTDLRVKRKVAVKLLRPGLSGNARFRERFASEAVLIAALHTPSVATLFDYGEEPADGGILSYLVLELVDGVSLAETLRRGLPSIAETTRIIASAAEGLDAAHRAGIVHRDVKPGNILVTADGSVKLIDFGIARAYGEAGLTEPGVLVGTVAYMSPEQLSDADPDRSADVYALGVVAYECLTGAPPFAGDSAGAVISGHLHREPPPLPGSVPEALAAVVSRALEKDPAKRWGSVLEFGRACREAGAGHAEVPVAVAAEVPDAVTRVPAEPVTHVPAGPVPAAEENATLEAADPDETVPVVPVAEATAPVAVGTLVLPDPEGDAGRAPVPAGATAELTGEIVAEKPRRRALVPVLAGVIVAVMVAALFLSGPWRRAERDGQAAGGGGVPAQSSDLGSAPVVADPVSPSPSGAKPDEAKSPEKDGDHGGGNDDTGGSRPGTGDDGGHDDGGSKGGDAVPDLNGMVISDAASTLRSKGFKNFAGVPKSYTSGSPCHVTAQSPAPGTKVNAATDRVTFDYNEPDAYTCGDIWRVRPLDGATARPWAVTAVSSRRRRSRASVR